MSLSLPTALPSFGKVCQSFTNTASKCAEKMQTLFKQAHREIKQAATPFTASLDTTLCGGENIITPTRAISAIALFTLLGVLSQASHPQSVATSASSNATGAVSDMPSCKNPQGYYRTESYYPASTLRGESTGAVSDMSSCENPQGYYQRDYPTQRYYPASTLRGEVFARNVQRRVQEIMLQRAEASALNTTGEGGNSTVSAPQTPETGASLNEQIAHAPRPRTWSEFFGSLFFTQRRGNSMPLLPSPQSEQPTFLGRIFASVFNMFS